MTTFSDPHAMRIAARVERHLAPAITLARWAIEAQIARIDGWPGTSTDPHVRTSRGTSSTEAAGERRAQLAADYQQLHDDLVALDTTISDLLRMCRRIHTGVEPAEDDHGPAIPLCFEGQTGKEGSIVWGDVTCAMPAVKRDLCQQHYDAWRKHRMSRGIDTSRDHQPAA